MELVVNNDTPLSRYVLSLPEEQRIPFLKQVAEAGIAEALRRGIIVKAGTGPDGTPYYRSQLFQPER